MLRYGRSTEDNQPVMSESPGTAVSARAQAALDSSPIRDLRHLHVEQTEAGLLITGSVTSFYHKQLVQETVRTVSDGVDLVNSVHVT